MSVASKCIGDIIVPLEVSGGDYGTAPVMEQAAYEIECRIDTFSVGESRLGRQADSIRSHRSYHASDPALTTGMLVRWTQTGVRSMTCQRVTFDRPPMLRVLDSGTEGRPGKPPKLWWVEYREQTAEQLEDVTDAS